MVTIVGLLVQCEALLGMYGQSVLEGFGFALSTRSPSNSVPILVWVAYMSDFFKFCNPPSLGVSIHMAICYLDSYSVDMALGGDLVLL